MRSRVTQSQLKQHLQIFLRRSCMQELCLCLGEELRLHFLPLQKSLKNCMSCLSIKGPTL
jgi:hypothetical protein